LDSSNSNAAVLAGVATIDEIALVPGKMRIYVKDATSTASHTFIVTATNVNGVVSAFS
jgi:hypothetical protein